MDIKRTDVKQRKRIQRIVFGSLGVIALGALIAGIARLEPAAPSVDRAQVWVDTVRRGELLREVRGPGTLVPREIRWIAAETQGRVERIRVRPGARVAANDVILELSNPELFEQVLAAESALAAAEADLVVRRVQLESQALDQEASLAGLEADYEAARLQAEAEGQLAETGVISGLNYQRTLLQAQQLRVRLAKERERIAKFSEVIEAQMRAEGARVDQLRSALQQRQRQRDSLAVLAGIDGVLQQVPVEIGQQVGVGVNLARVARPEDLMAELRIAETQAKDIQLDQPVRVDTRNGIVPGRVVRIDPAVQSGTVLIEVELTGALPPGARPDLSVDGTVEIERIADTLFVGRPAYGQPDSQVSLFRLDGDETTARRARVSLGRSSVNLIEIREGLAAGDKVILSDTSAYDDYDRLRLR